MLCLKLVIITTIRLSSLLVNDKEIKLWKELLMTKLKPFGITASQDSQLIWQLTTSENVHHLMSIALLAKKHGKDYVKRISQWDCDYK